MPTAAQRAGNFGSIKVTDPTTGVVFPNNVIPTSRIDPNGLALLNVFPMPNSSISSAYNYVSETRTNEPVQLATLKLDFNARQADVISVTLLGNWQSYTNPPDSTTSRA